jgi:tRNA(Ile)-lysidine synthase
MTSSGGFPTTDRFGTETVPVADVLHAALDVVLGRSDGPVVAAVSGGRDSMALLHALVRWARPRLAAVATFDHGTGPAATAAAALVAAEGRRLGLTVVRERARTVGRSEAQWRAARWSFLNRVARAFGARVATAHTRDDQAETVILRALRGAGARGLAGLAAPSPVLRPWLSVSRAEVASWAASERLPFVEDPDNASRRHLRVRVRLDLLPAFERASPGFTETMLAIGEQAAHWRREVEAVVDALGAEAVPRGGLLVPVAPLRDTTDPGRAVLWQALAGRIGVALDRRGTVDLVRFTMADRIGARRDLAGGAEVERVVREGRDGFELRPPRRGRLFSAADSWTGRADAVPRRVGPWSFRRAWSTACDATAAPTPDPSAWSMPLVGSAVVTIRPWRSGDRIRTTGAPTGRRVARYLQEAGVPVRDRAGWPVVLLEDEIVWVPGVCRGRAAPSRPGRPALIWYQCEREPG